MKENNLDKNDLISLVSVLSGNLMCWYTAQANAQKKSSRIAEHKRPLVEQKALANSCYGLLKKDTLLLLESVARIPFDESLTLTVIRKLGEATLSQNEDRDEWEIPTIGDDITNPMLTSTISHLSSMIIDFHAKRKILIKMSLSEFSESFDTAFNIDWHYKDVLALNMTGYLDRETDVKARSHHCLTQLAEAVNDAF